MCVLLALFHIWLNRFSNPSFEATALKNVHYLLVQIACTE
jgi:hypothetical protein